MHARADREHDRVVARRELAGRHVDADVDAVGEAHALGLEQLDPAVDVVLLELEVGHAEAQQPARALVALVDDDLVTRAIEVRGGREARGPGADHADAAPAAPRGRDRDDPALLPGALDDRQLDLLDRDRIVVDREHAGGLARRRADQAGPLGEVVRGVQLLDRLAPAALVDEVVPVRDQVAERAAVMAERDAALHAARALARRLVLGQDLVDLLEVGHALARIALRRRRTGDLQESAELSHRTAEGSRRASVGRSLAEHNAPARGTRGLDPAVITRSKALPPCACGHESLGSQRHHERRSARGPWRCGTQVPYLVSGALGPSWYPSDFRRIETPAKCFHPTPPAWSGDFRRPPGLAACFHPGQEWAGEDSNLRLSGYEPAALTAELPAPHGPKASRPGPRGARAPAPARAPA